MASDGDFGTDGEPGAAHDADVDVPTATSPWWRGAVLYQVYPRSFADSNGDGVGDLPGVIAHLDHLERLGVDGIWLSPVTASPNVDWGYDVSDYYAVHPELGTMADFDRLVRRAHQRDIRVLLDLVPNHTSDQHPWFVQSRSSRTAPGRDWYVWADPGADGAPPNNWVSSCGGPAWTLDTGTGQFYLHNHLAEQPDLNWWSDEVRAMFDDVFRFWFARGVTGFRIDVCNLIVKDAQLRDNPPATPDDDLDVQLLGQRPVYNGNRPEVHDVLRRWRRLADAETEDSVLIGETPVPTEELARYYGNGHDELHLSFNFPFLTAPFEAEALRTVVEDTEALLPAGAWPAWTGSNHDMSRFSSRWAGGDPSKARAALLMLLFLRGTPVLYQGDEIGLGDRPVAQEDLRDPLGVLFFPAYAGRDAMRTPMPWRGVPGGGFTEPGVRPWLPLDDPEQCNVESQWDDPGSMLVLARDAIALRRRTADLRLGIYETLESPDGVWAWRRGASHLVALNLSDEAAELGPARGRILLGNDRRRDGSVIDGVLALAAWEAVVVETQPGGTAP